MVEGLYGLTRVLWVGYAHRLQCTLHVGSHRVKTVRSGGVLADSRVPFCHCVGVVIVSCTVDTVNCSWAQIPTTNVITYNSVSPCVHNRRISLCTMLAPEPYLNMSKLSPITGIFQVYLLLEGFLGCCGAMTPQLVTPGHFPLATTCLFSHCG